MQSLFWILVFLAGYSYVGYPLLLKLLPPRSRRVSGDVAEVRRVSVIIAARNEALKIAAKLENTLDLRHPGFEVEVIVASDASDDGTDQIVEGFAPRGVKLARSPARNGKESAQRLAIETSTGEVIVFTDAGTTIPPDALEVIVAAFQAPDIGALSSVDKVVGQDGGIEGEGLYVRYEMWLRDLESRFNTLVGLSGSFFAARREVCQNWDTRVPSDFGTALNCARLGFRAVSQRNLIGYYRNIANPSREYARKLRTALRGMVGLKHAREVLNPSRFGPFSFQVISHKIMRWAVPWFLLGAFGVNLVLLGDSILYAISLAMLIALFTCPLLVRGLPFLSRLAPVRFAAFFVEANLAVLVASTLLMRGKVMLTWEPSRR